MPNVSGDKFIACDTPRQHADFVLFGAPFDSTASYRPGARFGCRAVRAESFGIETYSPYQDRDLADILAHDAGDLELCIGDADAAVSQIELFASDILAEGKVPVLIGGEHLVSLGAIRAAARWYPGLHILQLDAHADLRDDYLGQKLSHATVMRRAWEVTGDGRVHQFGIRSGDKSEFLFAKKHTDLHPFGLDGLDECVKSLAGKPVYVTLDLDVLDPSEFPGTGTPEAGGIRFCELMRAVESIGSLSVVGLDMTELCPVYDQSGVSTAAACKILRELLLSVRTAPERKV